MGAGSGGVLVVAETDASGGLRPVALETLTAGRALADAIGSPLTAVLAGHGVEAAARQLGALGADRVLLADDARLAALTPETTVAVLTGAIERIAPAVVLVPGTTLGRDAAPKVAARLGVGLAADAIAFAIDGGDLVATRPVLGGRAQAQVRVSGPTPRIATVRPGSFAKAEPIGTEIAPETLPVDLTDADLRAHVTGVEPKGGGASSLDTAEVVVSGGRGLKEPANFKLVEDLADAFGGAVGATRAVVDAGWRPHHEQIGQTGRTVSPKLYIAVGISGAVQHNVGMQGADYIVAINRDPDAPIFKVAAFGIVGDLFEVAPAVTAAVRAARG
ncbi:MAG TPA: electron transfer flavoprotein subunit alpha/FixB family protein [Thermomicrobiales bacterium]|nr:electron transfer flavoprotein subunit alpha/FixB family protein [Thermomicrobiales bacterium]